MSEEEIDFLISIQDLEQPEFDNACLERENKKLQQENKQLKENLRVSQSNEETYCLEMQEITKILGLDEHTLFDDVKDYAKQLKEDKKKAREFIYRYWITYDESKNFTELNEEMNILIKDIKKLLEILGDKENEI